MIANIMCNLPRGKLTPDEFSSVLERMRRNIIADGPNVGIIYDADSGDVQVSCISSDRNVLEAKISEIKQVFEIAKACHRLPIITVRTDTLRKFTSQPVSDEVQI